MEFNFNEKFTYERKVRFAQMLKDVQAQLDFKISSRGWAYQLEGLRLINKDQFDRVENAINACRRIGLLPIDFVAEEPARQFLGVENPDIWGDYTITDMLIRNLNDVMTGAKYYTPDWWEGEEYYIQVVVEKIDLQTLFLNVCRSYHIPIATSKGWSSMLQRAEYARRFAEAEERGMTCVLLYCGDHDPDGVRISDFLRRNLEQLCDVEWSDGFAGYHPDGLIIERFGLNFELIESLGLTWIDNLITGSKKNLASPSHKNHHMQYVQEYLRDVGERKCEANAIITRPDDARKLIQDTIERYLGDDARDRFQARRDAVVEEYKNLLNTADPDLSEKIEATVKTLRSE